MIALLAAARLCGALVSLYGAETGDARACRAGVIATVVAHEWPPELIAAIAYVESRFDPSVVKDDDLLGVAEHCDVIVVLAHTGFEKDPRTGDPEVGAAVLPHVVSPSVWLTSEFSVPMLVVDVKTLTTDDVYTAVHAWCTTVELRLTLG